MQLSPATLSTIAAVLSAQGVVVDHTTLQNILAPLTGEKTPQPDTPELRDGEFFLFHNTSDPENFEEFSTAESLNIHLKTLYEEEYSKRDSWQNTIEDEVTVFIARESLTVSIETNTVVKVR